MLEVRGLCKRYNRIPAVEGVSFTIKPGEILGYLGPNGAGKSTTVKVLTGLIEATAGDIFFNGRNVKEDFTVFQRSIGYVPEEPHLYPHLTGREYLQLIGRLRGLPRKVLEPRMDGMLRLFGFLQFLRRIKREFSVKTILHLGAACFIMERPLVSVQLFVGHYTSITLSLAAFAQT
jgi:ABC-type multidrug transport system ATPase subunit